MCAHPPAEVRTRERSPLERTTNGDTPGSWLVGAALVSSSASRSVRVAVVRDKGVLLLAAAPEGRDIKDERYIA